MDDNKLFSGDVQRRPAGRPQNEDQELPNVRPQILDMVEGYIRRTVGSDRKMQQSTKDMGEAIQLSHSTVNRAIRHLERKGSVRVDRLTQPNVIEFLGPLEADVIDLNESTTSLLKEMDDLTQRLRQHIEKLQIENQELRKQAGEAKVLRQLAGDWQELQPRLASEAFVPNRQELVLTFHYEEPPSRVFK